MKICIKFCLKSINQNLNLWLCSKVVGTWAFKSLRLASAALSQGKAIDEHGCILLRVNSETIAHTLSNLSILIYLKRF